MPNSSKIVVCLKKEGHTTVSLVELTKIPEVRKTAVLLQKWVVRGVPLNGIAESRGRLKVLFTNDLGLQRYFGCNYRTFEYIPK